MFEHEKIRVGVGIFIQDQENRVLLEKRRDCGLWCFPGGMVEAGEKIEETASREVKEETGLDIRVTGLLGVYSTTQHRIITYPDTGTFRLIDVVVSAEIIGGKLQSSPESFEVRFFEGNHLPELLPRAVQPIMDALEGKRGVFS
ncbi:MAG: NUDIX domain-containing protein [Deltaproteobacteria bacterium]|nr:NUDIX domain-containing protein [Deltaproteobacteria bacterium]